MSRRIGKEIEDLLEAARAGGPVAAVHVGAELEVLAHAHAGEELAAFRAMDDAVRDDARGLRRTDTLVAIDDVAFREAVESADRIKNRALAGAVRAEQHDELAVLGVQPDMVERAEAAVVEAGALKPQHDRLPDRPR